MPMEKQKPKLPNIYFPYHYACCEFPRPQTIIYMLKNIGQSDFYIILEKRLYRDMTAAAAFPDMSSRL